MKITKSRLLGSAAPLLAMLLTTPVLAQEAPAEEADSGIADIVVTAQRREENNQNVPISISAFSEEQLKAQGANDISRLEGIVPGFTFGRSGADARPAIRGVRTENVGVNGDTTIGFFIDGIYQSRSTQATLSFVDIQRVEIQRGPQGTLYGRNTFGGNIAISTNAPSLKGYAAGLDLTVGRFGRFRSEGYINVPLSDTLAVRFAGALEESNGFVKNVNPLGNNLFDDKSRYLRSSLLFEPNDRLTVNLKFDYSQQGGAGGSAFGYKLVGTYFDIPSNQPLFNATQVFINNRAGNRDGVIDPPFTTDNGIPIFAQGNPYRIDTDQPTVLDLKNYGFASNIAYDLGPVTVKSITGYTDFKAIRTSDTDFSASQIGVDYQLTAVKTFSQEVQLLSNGKGPFTYVLGGYYFKDKLTGIFINQQTPRIIRSVTPNLILPQNGGGFYDQQRPETESVAAYAQASYQVAEKLKLTAGLRYTQDTKDFRFANANAILPLSATNVPLGTAITLRTGPIPASAFGSEGAATNCTFTTFPPPRSGFRCLAANTTVLTGATYDTAKFRRATWRVGADYQLSDDSLLYTSVSTGFRSGGFNSGQNQAALQPTFRPEKVLAFEVGSKNRFADDTIQINVAAFYNKYTGLQEQRQIPVGATTLSIIENSGKARSYGAELEAIWKPVPALTLGSSFSYLNAKYTEYDQVPLAFGTSILVNDITQTAPTLVNGIQIAGVGQRRVFAPGFNCGLVPGTGGVGQPPIAFGCDLSGKSIPYSPEYSGSVYASYDIDFGSAGKLIPYAIVTFSGKFFGQPFNSPLDTQKAFEKIDLRLTWQINDSVELQGFVTNVTDKATATRFVFGGGPALQASFAPPRQYGVRASFKF